jgi:hypothetical protein
MDDVARVLRDVFESLGPTNRIARQLVNRLELAEDAMAEAEVIVDELSDIAELLWSTSLVALALADLEDDLNRP